MLYVCPPPATPPSNVDPFGSSSQEGLYAAGGLPSSDRRVAGRPRTICPAPSVPSVPGRQVSFSAFMQYDPGTVLYPVVLLYCTVPRYPLSKAESFSHLRVVALSVESLTPRTSQHTLRYATSCGSLRGLEELATTTRQREDEKKTRLSRVDTWVQYSTRVVLHKGGE